MDFLSVLLYVNLKKLKTMSDIVVNYDYVKEQMFHYAELFSVEKKKEPLNFNELIYLNRSVRNHMQIAIIKLNEENPHSDGIMKGNIFTPNEADRYSELMAIDKSIIEQIENEFGDVWYWY